MQRADRNDWLDRLVHDTLRGREVRSRILRFGAEEKIAGVHGVPDIHTYTTFDFWRDLLSKRVERKW